MGGSAIKAGETFVEFFVEKNKMLKDLRSIEGTLKTVGTAVAGVGLKFTALGGAVGAALFPALKSASDLQETMGKFNTVFGESADRVKAWGDQLADDIGRSRQQIAGFLSESQDLFVPLGFEPGAAEKMSKTITQLAIDLASFNNKEDADSFNDLTSALTGSSEVMKKYGVIVNEAAVKARLLQDGIDPKAATDQQKVYARLNIILEKTTSAQGDAARTSDSWANQMKRLSAVMTNFKEAVGTPLLGAFTDYLIKINETIPKVEMFVGEHQDLMVDVAKAAAVISGLGVTITSAGAALAVAGVAAGGFRTAIAAGQAVTGMMTTTTAASAAATNVYASAATNAARATAAWSASMNANTAAMTANLGSSISAATFNATAASKAFGKFRSAAGMLGGTLKALGPLIAGLAILEISKQIYSAMPSIKKLNEELEKTIELTERMNAKLSDRQSRILEQAGQLSGKQKNDFLTQQIAIAQKEADGLAASLKGAEKRFDSLNSVAKRWTGNKVLQDAKLEVDEVNKRLKAQKKFVDDLINQKSRVNADQSAKQEPNEQQLELQRKREELESFAANIRESSKTPEQKTAELIEKLNQALAARLITVGEYESELARIAQEHRESVKAAQEEEARQQEQAMQVKRNALQEEIRGRVDLARANKDFIGEMKAIGQGARKAESMGMPQLAADLVSEQLQGLTARAADLEQQYADSLIAADMTTSSAQEAMFGIGTETVDQQALEEAQAARRAAEKAKDYLAEIVRLLED